MATPTPGGGEKTFKPMPKKQIAYFEKRLMEERMNFAQRFRFNQLVAKFSVYKDLWRRQTQDREEKGVLRSEEELVSLTRPEQAEPSGNRDYFRVSH